MNQKQRGSDKQKWPQVKVILKAKEITVKGKKFDLEPFVEKIGSGFERIPKDVSEAMGIHLIVPEIELLLFDNKGFKEHVREIDGEEYKGHYMAFYLPGRKEIPINVEGRAVIDSETLEDNESMDGIVLMAIASCSWHEVAHMAHDLYDSKAMEKREKVLKEFWAGRKRINVEKLWDSSKNEPRDIKLIEWFSAYKIAAEYAINYRHALGYWKELALIEGIARWTEREVIRKNVSKIAAEATYGIPKPMKLGERIDLCREDEYAFGYRFFEKISRMTDANVIKLAIQHNPTYVEMLYPELYILRMKAALLI